MLVMLFMLGVQNVFTEVYQESHFLICIFYTLLINIDDIELGMSIPNHYRLLSISERVQSLVVSTAAEGGQIHLVAVQSTQAIQYGRKSLFTHSNIFYFFINLQHSLFTTSLLLHAQ